MSEARAEILARIEAATADVDPAEASTYVWEPPTSTPADLDLLVERIRDYRAEVTRVADRAAVPAAVEATLARHAATRIAIDPRLPAELRPKGGIELIEDERQLSSQELEALDGVLTTAALAVAETGTLILDGGPGQGRRALTLLPDLHVCVIEAERVRGDITAAISELRESTVPITFISGPSATSDIELERVEGVHGPRRLEVLLIG